MKTLSVLVLIFWVSNKNFIFLINKKFQKKFGFIYYGIELYTQQKPIYFLVYLLFYISLGSALTYAHSHQFLFLLNLLTTLVCFFYELIWRKHPEVSFWVYE